MRGEGTVDGYRFSKCAEYEVVDGDYQKEYTACQLKVGHLNVEDVGEYRPAGEGEYQQDGNAYDNSCVEGFLALAFWYMIGDTEKHWYIANGINYGE